MTDSSLEKIALITGTSSGIGLSTAVQLAQHGFKVIATMRDTHKAGPLEEQARLAGVSLDVRKLDVEDASSVETCVQEVIQSCGHIDILVNNAGAGFLATMEQTSTRDLQHTMELNFFGAWRVPQAVFPSMRAARSGRIITVTSIGGLHGRIARAICQPGTDARADWAGDHHCRNGREATLPLSNFQNGSGSSLAKVC